LVSVAVQSKLWTEPKAQTKVRTEPWLRPNEKFDFTFGSSPA